MAPPKSRRRHLQKLAERRAAERRKVRRKKVTAIVVAFAVAAAGGVFAFFALTGNPKKPSASPSASASPSSNVAAPTACDQSTPPASGAAKPTWGAAPAMSVDPTKHYVAVMKTSKGTIEIALDAAHAPNTVNSIVFLAKCHFFDGLTFHRIVKNFVIQGGDPKGDGTGGPGYQTVDAPPAGTKYAKGDVAMAKSQADPPGGAGSQFFIVTGDPAPLNASPVYALVGKVIKGLDVAVAIEQLPAKNGAQDGPPATPVIIESVTIRVG